jgi:insertion element IS1 protein InsB
VDSFLTCPSCGSHCIVKNGSIHNKKQKYKCKECQRQFIENPTNKIINDETKELIDRLLLEKISLAGISRATGVSKKWLQDYVNSKYGETSRQIEVSSKKPGKIEIECDEAWSFVTEKNNKQWIWLALDKKTREIVGCYIGERGETGAKGLWNSLPPVYRQCAVCYTDFWAAYAQVIPKNRHKAVGKETGLTNHIERFNNTLRQRVSRLVRKTLSFSKKLENHIGAIWNFIHHYNLAIALSS